MGRPLPPSEILEPTGRPRFEPSPELQEWALSTFIEDGADLENEEHAHLKQAEIGFLWTNVANSRKQRRIVGQCETGKPQGAMGKWAKARAEAQIIGWFGFVPDFIITIDAHYASHCEDAEFMALIEHELCHASQERDEFGQPKFTREGKPVFGIRGHDVEEFISVVRRYGADAAGIRDLIEAAKAGPEIAPARIAQSCGTCLSRAA